MKAVVLIAEDEPDTRELLQWQLEEAGLTVITAPDGAAALRLLAAHRPDLVVTDLRMPGISGIELIRVIRGVAEWVHLPIVVLSAYSNVCLMEAHRSGATVVLQKPKDLPKVVETIKSLLPDRGAAEH